METDAVSISTRTELLVGSLSTSWIVPEKVLNPPSCLRVTLAATNETFESADENAKLLPPAGFGSAAFGSAAVPGSETWACELSLPGSVLQADSKRHAAKA